MTDQTSNKVWAVVPVNEQLIDLGRLFARKEDADKHLGDTSDVMHVVGMPTKVIPLYKSDRILTVYDWAYIDTDGVQRYARTPEKASKLSQQGIKITPVYTLAEDSLP